jgi:hypothetical protein
MKGASRWLDASAVFQFFDETIGFLSMRLGHPPIELDYLHQKWQIGRR